MSYKSLCNIHGPCFEDRCPICDQYPIPVPDERRYMTDLETKLLSALRMCRSELAIFLKSTEHLTVRDNHAIQQADKAIDQAEKTGIRISVVRR